MNLRILYIVIFNCFFINIFSQSYKEFQKISAIERINQSDFCTKIQYVGDFAFFGQYKYKKIKSPGDTVFHAGAVHIYKLDSLERWEYHQKLENTINKVWDNFAWDVKVSNDFTLVVSAYCANSFNCEIVYIYEKNDLDIWVLKQEIKPQLINNTYSSNFGFSVAINENYLAISAKANRTDENNQNPILGAGAVFIYTKNTSGIWVLNQKIVAPVRKAHNAFGVSLNFNNNMLFVGMPFENTNSNNLQNMGVVFVYMLDINSNWVLHQQITPNLREAEALFGRYIEGSDSTLVISASYGNIDELGDNYVEKSGGVFIFELDESGFWLEKQKLLPEPRLPFQYFGNSLVVHNNIIVVGSALEDDLQFNESGAVYVFKKNENNSWVLLQKIYPEIPQINKQFGYAVAVYDNQILISAIGEKYDENNENPINFAGAVYYYKNCTPSHFKDEITVCDQFTWIDGKTYSESNNTASITLKNHLNCDSVITLDLTILPSKNTELNIASCTPYTWNATTYSQSGTYTYQTISSNGCDSIATLHLAIHSSSESEENINACDTYVWNGNTYTDNGIYTYQTLNAVGCDSTATLHLTIYPSYADTLFVTTCDDYTWNGNIYTNDGIYSIQAQSANGCDSISTLVLTIQNTIQTQINITACDQYDWNGSTYTQSGVYTYQTTSSSGCDSIVTLYLDVFPSVMTQENFFACDSFMWLNQILTTSGTYTHQEMTLQGCDSTKQLFLTILPSTTSQVLINACESFDWNGQTYTSSGLYTYQTNNHAGCDSTAFLELTIHPKVNKTFNVTSCYSYEWNGETYTQSGHYSITRPNQFGCDSTTTLQLTIHPSYQNTLTLSACTEVEYQNNTYTTSGMYLVPLQSVFGCDSIITLTININAQSFEESQSACDSFYWPQSQEQYHESGIYEAVFMNAQGCDSTYQLTLEILPSYRQSEVREVCETYTWPNNQQTYTQSGIYTIQGQSQRGCDSIQSLDLTIYEGFRKRDTIIADSSYTWPVNGITYETSGAYEERYTSGEGCDSIHYLVLRIESTYTIQFPNIIIGGTNTNLFKGFSSHDNVVLKELSIYDRMASLVYHVENTKINDPNYGWNGTFRGMEVIPGVYVWMAEVLLPDGSTRRMAGDVTIIR